MARRLAALSALVLAGALAPAPAAASRMKLSDVRADELAAIAPSPKLSLPEAALASGPFDVGPKTRVRGFEVGLHCSLGGEQGLTCGSRPAYASPYGANASDISVYTGYIYSPLLELYHAGARTYDPATGRFTQQDSYLGKVDQPPSLHRYVYGWNRPTFWTDPTGHAPGEEEEPRKLLGGREASIGPRTAGSVGRGAVYYGLETAAEFVSPIPLGLSDPDTSIHPLAGNNQATEDYDAFKAKYGRGAQVAEGTAAMKYGGKIGKVVGGVMILGAVAFGSKPEVNGTQGEQGSFGPDKGEREPLPGQKEVEQRAASDSGPYRGGPHGETKGPRGDELDSHHVPADSTTTLPKDKGPAIQMERADHVQTSSHGSKGLEAAEYRAEVKALVEGGEWRKALAQEIKDVRQIAGTKYNQAIKEMLEYARTLKETGFLKKVEK